MPRHFFLLHRQLSEHQALRNEMESIILIYAVTDNILFVRIYFYKYKIIFHISVMHPFTISLQYGLALLYRQLPARHIGICATTPCDWPERQDGGLVFESYWQ